jgi:hypothetical protein
VDSLEAERLGSAPADEAFITGNGIAARCRHVLNYGPPTINAQAEEEWWFCKLDRLPELLAHAPRRRFVLVTHNSDYPVDERHRRVLRSPRIRAWLATNVALRHRKLVPVPLGIANPGWEHGDTGALRAAQAGAERKEVLVDVSFSLETNPDERRRCLEASGLTPAPRVSHREYLQRLAASYFCLAPPGYGRDTHRTWEALYLRTVPIVRRSALTDEYRDLPWLVLDDWSQLRSLELTPELYARLMGGWRPTALSLDALFARLRRRVRRRPARTDR